MTSGCLSLGSDDGTRLDQYLSSVREVEERLLTAREWELKPKPATQQPVPADIQDKKLFIEKLIECEYRRITQ